MTPVNYKQSGSEHRKIPTHLRKYLIFYEVFLLVVIILGIIIRLRSGSSLLLLPSILVLASMYLMVVFAVFPSETRAMEKLIFRLMFWFQSMLSIGIFFYLQKWPLTDSFLGAGTIGILLLALILLFSRPGDTHSRKLKAQFLIRSLLSGIVGVMLLLL